MKRSLAGAGRRLRAAPLLLLLCAAPAAGGSAQPGPAEARRWIETVNRQRLRASWHLALTMTLRDDHGYHRDLELDTRWAVWKETAAALVVVRAPEELRGTALLSREEAKPGVPDRSWVFLNTRNPLVMAVTGTARTEGLLGSDFSHDDQQRLLDPTAWDLSWGGEAPCGGGRCVRIEGVRRSPRRGPFDPDHIVWWIDRKRQEIARAELSAGGRLIKVLEVTEWAEASGVAIPRRQSMRTLPSGSETVLTLRRFEEVAGYPERDFQPDALPTQARRPLP